MGVNGLYGLSGSGLDIESMVKAGMLSRQNQYDKMYKKEVKNEWLKQGFNEIYTSLNTFKFSTLSDYKMSSKMNAMGAESGDTSVVKAVANADAVAMTHNVEVTSLSQNAYLMTGNDGITRANTDASSSIYLKDIAFQSITKNDDGTFNVTFADGTTQDNVSGDDTAIAFTVRAGTESLTDDEKSAQTVSYTFADIFESKTMNDLAADIKNLNTNVTASYDATNDMFTLYNKESGSDSVIGLSIAAESAGGKGAAALFKGLNLHQSAGGVLADEAKTFTADAETSVEGKDGEAIIDGRTYTGIKDSKVTVSGVTYSLANVGKTTVAVTQDTDAIIDNVKKFVEDYNKILDDLTEKYNTKPSGDYEPLTKTQEASMTQEQIDKWTEKAKEGLFYHNDILRGIISDMRDAIMTPVQSVHSSYNSASAIGITTSNNQGHLQLDEDKLKKALAADPDCVYEIFASDQDTYTSVDPNQRQSYMATDDYNNRGIANRLYFNAITDGISKVEDYAGVLADSDDQSTLGLLITQLKTKMDNFKALMDDFQTQLYKKYDALEVMISQMNAQYNTIFGGSE